ncbi:43031_t:CDS:1, partial [Gigaspora margarita]
LCSLVTLRFIMTRCNFQILQDNFCKILDANYSWNYGSELKLGIYYLKLEFLKYQLLQCKYNVDKLIKSLQ